MVFSCTKCLVQNFPDVLFPHGCSRHQIVYKTRADMSARVPECYLINESFELLKIFTIY